MLFAASSLLVGASLAPSVEPASVAFVDRSVTTPAGTFAYQVFVPKKPAKRPPVILFLHGSGERGSDNRAQTKNGIRFLIAQDPERFPAVVVAPQCREEARWTDPAMKAMALAALDAANKEFHGDPDRQYLTGLSLGGYGTWAIAGDDSSRWAAIAPVCGANPLPKEPKEPLLGPDAQPVERYLSAARAVRYLPSWVFHGDSDPVVPVAESRQMVAVLLNLGAEVRYTEYANVGHNSWDLAYSEPKLLEWLLAHRRRR